MGLGVKTIELMALIICAAVSSIWWIVDSGNYTETQNLIPNAMINTINPSLKLYRYNKRMLKES